MTERTLPPTEPITLEGAPNFRDLGGYQTADGRVVRRGMVFRSGMLAGVTDSDLATMESLGIRTVVDLRTPLEVDVLGVDRLPAGARLVSLALPTAGIDPVAEIALRTGRFPYLLDLATVNRGYIRDDAARFGELLGLFAESANLPVIVHCLGGKDRTGVTAALLLTVLGVPWATVREDYLRSNDYYRGTVDAESSPLSRAMEAHLGHSPDFGDEETKQRFFVLRPSYIDVVRDEMTSNSRSIAEFINDELQLTNDTVERLRSQLLE